MSIIPGILKHTSGLQTTEKSPILAPGVIDIEDENGDFVVRYYDGHYYDEDGDEIYDDD